MEKRTLKRAHIIIECQGGRPEVVYTEIFDDLGHNKGQRQFTKPGVISAAYNFMREIVGEMPESQAPAEPCAAFNDFRTGVKRLVE